MIAAAFQRELSTRNLHFMWPVIFQWPGTWMGIAA